MFKLLILLCLPLIHSKWIDGTIKTLESWTYISKFAFKGPGVFSDYTFFKIPRRFKSVPLTPNTAANDTY